MPTTRRASASLRSAQSHRRSPVVPASDRLEIVDRTNRPDRSGQTASVDRAMLTDLARPKIAQDGLQFRREWCGRLYDVAIAGGMKLDPPRVQEQAPGPVRTAPRRARAVDRIPCQWMP